MSRLDEEFAARGLLRLGLVARLLHCPHDSLKALIDQNGERGIQSEMVRWGSGARIGVTSTEVRRVHNLMWADGCPGHSEL